MRERCSLIGGKMEIFSDNRGTIFSVEVPLPLDTGKA